MKRVSKALSLTLALALTLVLATPALGTPERAEGPVTVAQQVVNWVESAVARVLSVFTIKGVTLDDQDDGLLDPILFEVDPHG